MFLSHIFLCGRSSNIPRSSSRFTFKLGLLLGFDWSSWSGCLALGLLLAPQLLGEREHGNGGQQHEAANGHRSQPPGADPARIGGIEAGIREVHIPAGAEAAENETRSGSQDPHANGDGHVHGRLFAAHIVIDIGNAQGGHGGLANAGAQQAAKENAKHDDGNLGVGGLLQLALLVALAARERFIAAQGAEIGIRLPEGGGGLRLLQDHTGVHQLLAEDEMGQGAGEGGNGEEDHAAGYPPGAMTPSGEVGQQHGRAYLTHLTGTQQDTRGLRLDLEELLDGGDHG